MLGFNLKIIRGYLFSFIELSKYIDFTMNLLVRRGEYEMPTNNSPENILHTAYETKMISSGDN